MSKQIIRLNTAPAAKGSFSLRVVFWFPQSGTLVPKHMFVSAAPNVSSAELDSLRSGATLEEVHVLTFSTGLSNADIQTLCQNAYTARLNHLNTLPAQGAYYGTSYDGTSWSG